MSSELLGRDTGICRNCFIRWRTPGFATCPPCFYQPDRWRPHWSDTTDPDVWWARMIARYPHLQDEPDNLRRAA